jgi:hypothetical protein
MSTEPDKQAFTSALNAFAFALAILASSVTLDDIEDVRSCAGRKS